MMVTRADRLHSRLMQLGAWAIVAYWVDFFTGGHVRTSDDEDYIAFERTFLLADGYLAGTALLAGRLLGRGRPEAVGAGIAAGSAAIFLGLMDLKYNIQHGKFADNSPEMKAETGIIVTSLTFGLFTMLRLWKARDRLSV